MLDVKCKSCSECANLINTPTGTRCRYEWEILTNPRGGACARGERFVPREVRE